MIQPGDLRAVRYTQGLLAVTCPHRISGGIGVVDVLPGIDMDLMAGGMFDDTEQLGDFTVTSIESYWIGLGLTWRLVESPATSCLLPTAGVASSRLPCSSCRIVHLETGFTIESERCRDHVLYPVSARRSDAS